MDKQGTLLRGARVVLPDRVAEKVLLIENDRIARISADIGSSDAREEDLRGLTLFPGFIDFHIHGAVGVDTMDATPTALNQVSQFLSSKGVTSWLPTLVPATQEQYERAVNAVTEVFGFQQRQLAALPNNLGARVLGIHYEGPFVSAALCGALHAIHFRSYSSAADLDALPVISYQGAVHMMTMAPEIDGGIELVSELKKRGWTVSIGHTRAKLEELDRACEAGAAHLTHFMNAMPSMHHRSLGPVGWCLSRDDVTCDLIADGIHLEPAMLRLLVKLKLSSRLSLISDSIAAAGLGDGEYRIWDEIIEVKNGRTRNPKGSIAGSVISMLDAVQLMRSLGTSEVDVALMAATNPSQLLCIDEICGSIAEGKLADLVALDDQGKVVLTLVGGRVVFDCR